MKSYKKKKSYSSLTVSLLLVLLLFILSQTRTINQRLRNDIEKKEMYIEYLTVENKVLEKEIEKLEKAIEEERLRQIDLEAFTIATFKLETGHGTSNLWIYSNNPGGIKCGNEYCTYSTQEEGIQALTNLMERYLNKYGTLRTRDLRDEYCWYCGDKDYEIFIELLNTEYARLNNGISK